MTLTVKEKPSKQTPVAAKKKPSKQTQLAVEKAAKHLGSFDADLQQVRIVESRLGLSSESRASPPAAHPRAHP